ncbi:MAG: SRPBCC domain-containing protein [Candidatus Hermodarchaeota archaeon]
MNEIIEAEIKQSTLIRASPEKIYDAFFTGAGLDSWFTSGSEVDARPGGTIKFSWKDWGPDKYTQVSKGKVLEAERGKRFVFQWSADNPAYFTTIEIDLEETEEGTILRLREHGYHNTPSGRAAMAECAAGWGEAVTLLKFYVEHDVTY